MMTNEMMRPCTLWGETFDACDVKAVNDYLTFKEESAFPSGGHHGSVLIRDPFKGDISSPRFKTQRESYKAVLEAITAIADALNAPVKVTQAVLDAMEKVPEAKFRIQKKCPATASPIYYSCFYEEGCGTLEKGWHYWTPSDYIILGEFNEVEEGDYIQADCPLALQVLLGFTTEGVLA